MNPDYRYKATVVRVVDGDTIDCDVDLGFYVTSRIRFRVARIDAPEVRGAEKVAGKAATEWVKNFIVGRPLVVESLKTGKYGRWIGEFYVTIEGTEFNLSDELVLAGHAEYSEG